MILAALAGFLVDLVVVELTVGLDALDDAEGCFAGFGQEKGEKPGENVGDAIVFEVA